jgi:hypothetical protein
MIQTKTALDRILPSNYCFAVNQRGYKKLIVGSDMQIVVLLFAALVCLSLSCQTRNGPEDPYVPKLQLVETNDFTGKPEVAYRFTEEQLNRMAQTKLETNRLVAYLENRWPIERLQAFCVPTNRFPEMAQNLVAYNCPIETDLYKGKAHGFDRIWVYVSQDDGQDNGRKVTYVGEAGTHWHRWECSLNIVRGGSHWVIGVTLPNDFMDSPKYDPSLPLHQ